MGSAPDSHGLVPIGSPSGAYFVWNSTPDDALISAGTNNELVESTQLQAQISRILQDDRASRGIDGFYRRWLNIAAFDELARDNAGFGLPVARALSASLLMSATKLYSSPSPNISNLFSGESYYMNDALRQFYGFSGTGTDFTPVTLSNEGRHGLLTHPGLLALLARPNQSNPISRGLFIIRNLLCMLSKYQQMNQWIASQIAGLMKRLAAIPSASGSGTVLDETVIYWFNRHGDGNSHSNDRLPNVILGGAGGYFKMGRWLQLPGTSPTKVLISIANAMGVTVNNFGSGAFASNSALAGLTT